MLESKEGMGVIGVLNTIISNAIAGVLFIFLYHKKIWNDIKNLKVKYIVMAVLTALGLVVASTLVSLVFELAGIPMKNQDMIVSAMKSMPIATSIAVAILAPIVEEFVFRYSISTFIKDEKVFLIVSSLLFALMHGVGIATLLYFFMGACFGLLYQRTEKNIGASILAHVINNTISVISMLI